MDKHVHETMELTYQQMCEQQPSHSHDREALESPVFGKNPTRT